MIKLLLKIIGEKRIIKYLLENSRIEDGDAPSDEIWQEVYNKVPDLKKWFKKREVALLKSQVLKDRSSDFILGQLFENRVCQRFDTSSPAERKEYVKEEVRIPDKVEFLNRWNKVDNKTTNKK